MEVVFLASGERLVVLDQNDFEGKPAKAVKQSLAPHAGASRFRQRLFLEDGSEIRDDEIVTVPNRVQQVVLGISTPDTEQSQQMFVKTTIPMLWRSCCNKDWIAM